MSAIVKLPTIRTVGESNTEILAAVLPEAAASQTWKGKPLVITFNPWVWAYTFKRIEKP